MEMSIVVGTVTRGKSPSTVCPKCKTDNNGSRVRKDAWIDCYHCSLRFQTEERNKTADAHPRIGGSFTREGDNALGNGSKDRDGSSSSATIQDAQALDVSEADYYLPQTNDMSSLAFFRKIRVVQISEDVNTDSFSTLSPGQAKPLAPLKPSEDMDSVSLREEDIATLPQASLGVEQLTNMSPARHGGIPTLPNTITQAAQLLPGMPSSFEEHAMPEPDHVPSNSGSQIDIEDDGIERDSTPALHHPSVNPAHPPDTDASIDTTLSTSPSSVELISRSRSPFPIHFDPGPDGDHISRGNGKVTSSHPNSSRRSSDARRSVPRVHWMILPFNENQHKAKVHYDVSGLTDNITLEDGFNRHRMLSREDREKSACKIPIQSIIIFHQEFPNWKTFINKPRSYVRVIDVLDAIHDMFDVCITAMERGVYANLVRSSLALPDPISYRSPSERARNMRRFDLLLDKKYFGGLEWIEPCEDLPDGAWMLAMKTKEEIEAY
ncbi:hypothetical protein OF83DRAFT_501860 [Amylostereum chailletii]|nr:hypothetical protein OF83DRAFT_501860 [Amylostereum chailletii]